MKKSAKVNALKDMMGRAMAARAGRGAMAAPAAPMGMGMKKGGSFRTSANGIAKKGKTKGKQITMKNGGKC
jgi:hypothetical protein